MKRYIEFTLLALLAAGCGRVVGTKYPGEPLATISGTMTKRDALDITGPVRLALVWYHEMYDSKPSDPGAIVAHELTYQGTFPMDFTFHIYQPPPPGVLTPSGSGHFAGGILVAYVDGNGNGTLDMIEKGGPVVDQIVGATDSIVGFPDEFDKIWYYGTNETAADAGGFELETGTVVDGRLTFNSRPLSGAQVRLELTGEAELAALVCRASYSEYMSSVYDPNPLGFCDLAPTPNILRVLAYVDDMRHEAAGSVTVSAWASVQLFDGADLLGGEVLLNGVPMTMRREPPSATFPHGLVSFDLADDGAIQHNGINVLEIRSPPYPPRIISLPAIAQVQVTSPAAGASVRVPFKVDYTASGNDNVSLFIQSQTDPSKRWFRWGAPSGTTVRRLDFSGPARLRASAFRVWGDRFGSFISRGRDSSRDITVLP